MVDTKLVRENPPDTTLESTGTPAGVSTGIVNQLTRWIPSETVLLYVALLATYGTLKPVNGKKVYELDYTSRWVALWTFLVVTVLLVIGLTYGKARRNGKKFTWPIFELIIAPISFVAWAVALPDTPLLDFNGYSIAVGGFILLAVTVGVSVLAYIFDKSPDYETVVTS
jgi:hypothetical protein